MGHLTQLVNTQLGRYTISERLGAGGMATVYKAEDSNLKRQVAIKVLHEHLGYDETFRERFEREAQFIAGFNHPNIVQIYDYAIQESSAQSFYYMVMPYLPGDTLTDVLRSYQHQTMPYSRIQRIITELLSALGYAHEREMVHRDVKPDNILFDENGRAILTDFGIARLVETSKLTQDGTLVGTPAYMSPEQAAGQPVDARSDLYSLGVILYEMLAGQTPFPDDSAASILLKHINEPVPELASIIDIDNPAIDALIKQALAKDPDARFQTASAFADAVRRTFEGQDTPMHLRELAEMPAIKQSSSIYTTPTQYTPPPNNATRNLSTPTIEKPKRNNNTTTTRILSTLETTVVQPARQNPMAFIAMGIAIVTLLIVARMSQQPVTIANNPPPVAGDIAVNNENAADEVSSMTDSMTDSMVGERWFESEFDLTDPENRYWPQTSEGNVQRIVDSGNYIIRNLATGTASTTLYDPAYTYDDFTLIMEATLEEDSPSASGYGIIFRYQDARNYNVFAIDGRGRYSIWKLEDGIWTELRNIDEPWTESPVIMPLGTLNAMGISVKDNTLTGYINYRQVVQIEDDTFDKGAVGIYLATTSRDAATIRVNRFIAEEYRPPVASMTGDGTETDSMTFDDFSRQIDELDSIIPD